MGKPARGALLSERKLSAEMAAWILNAKVAA
jgi:hypothetical protein